MKLDANAMHRLGQHLDRHNIPAEDRVLLCWIEGTQYRVDEEGCWRFVVGGADTGWSKCVPPVPLRELFGGGSRLHAA
jgi:hypothetical protein